MLQACQTVTRNTRVKGEKAKLPASFPEIETNICLQLFPFNSKYEISVDRTAHQQRCWLQMFLWSPAPRFGTPHVSKPATAPVCASAQRYEKPSQICCSIIGWLGSCQPGHENHSSSNKLKARAVTQSRTERSTDLVHLPSAAKGKALAQPQHAHGCQLPGSQHRPAPHAGPGGAATRSDASRQRGSRRKSVRRGKRM